MRKKYTKPKLEIEQFRLTQQITSCTFMQIGFGDSICVLKDKDPPDEMKRVARAGYFLDDYGCKKSASALDEFEGLCHWIDVNMAFTS